MEMHSVEGMVAANRVVDVDDKRNRTQTSGTSIKKRFDHIRSAALGLMTGTIMKTITLKPERQAELEEFARLRGKTPTDALDEALGSYLEWERQDFEDAVQGIQQGYNDVKAGRTRPADQFLSDMRQKHGISR